MAVRTEPMHRSMRIDEIEAFVRKPDDLGHVNLLGPMPLPEAFELLRQEAGNRCTAKNGLRSLAVITPESVAAWDRLHAQQRPRR